MFSTGAITFARVRGIPLRAHWTLLLGALAWNGFSFAPVRWAAFVLLVLLHELGHAFFVRRYGFDVLAITLHGMGGVCLWGGEATRKQRAIIAWGGVVVQAIVFAATWIALAVVGAPQTDWIADVATVFTTVNLGNIAFNLIPIPPLDGAKAWTLLPILWAERRARRADRAAKARARVRAAEPPLPRPTGNAVLHDPTEDEGDPPPMPAEVEAVLDRILDEVRHEQRAKREQSRG